MIQNMRDLGGTKTLDGRSIKPFMLIRSANLLQAEATDLEHIATVIDLRTFGERKEAPDRTHGREYLPLPVFDDVTAGISHEQGADDMGVPDMAVLYGRMMNECAASFAKILKTVMEHDFSRGAVLWHCSEGKDRCGMTAALIMEALGVDRETILEDYLKTNLVNIPKAAAVREKLTASHGKAFADRVYQAYIADERYLRAAWEAMGAGYITDKLGIDGRMIEAFREKVLEKDLRSDAE